MSTVKKPVNYLSNKNLLEIIQQWKDSGNERVPDALGLAFMKLTDKYINHANFRGYPTNLKEEMKSSAIVSLVRYAHKFDPAKSENPFAYFTQICKNAYIGVIMNEYNHQAKAVSVYLSETENLDLTEGYNELLADNLQANRNANSKKVTKKSKHKDLFDE